MVFFDKNNRQKLLIDEASNDLSIQIRKEVKRKHTRLFTTSCYHYYENNTSFCNHAQVRVHATTCMCASPSSGFNLVPAPRGELSKKSSSRFLLLFLYLANSDNNRFVYLTMKRTIEFIS